MSGVIAWQTKDLEAKTDALRALIARGHTAGQIAKAFSHKDAHVSRSAVIGFCHRHGIALAGATGRPVRAKAVKAAEPAGSGRAGGAGKVGKVGGSHVRAQADTVSGQAIGVGRAVGVGMRKRDAFGFGRKRPAQSAAVKAGLSAAERREMSATSFAERGKGVMLDDLTAQCCRWPLFGWGVRADLDGLYCGGKKEHGAYCRVHADLAYVAPEKRKRAADDGEVAA